TSHAGALEPRRQRHQVHGCRRGACHGESGKRALQRYCGRHGHGIPLAEQTRIFEQFHQVDSSLTKAKGGTGLGLAIAKQIVEMHGEHMWDESTLGKGSTFQMELPTRAATRCPSPVAQPRCSASSMAFS